MQTEIIIALIGGVATVLGIVGTYLATRPKSAADAHKTDAETFVLNADTLEKWIGKFEQAKELTIQLKETISELNLTLDEEKENSVRFRRRVKEICERAEKQLNGATGYDALIGELKILKLEIEGNGEKS